MKLKHYLIVPALFATLFYTACKKTSSPAGIENPPVTDTTVVVTPPAAYQLSYGDSVFYLRNEASDYIVYPTVSKSGHYIGFPEGIELDEKTGAINVSKSEMGLRYRITFISADLDTTSTIVTLSGINYLDQYYNLSQGDSISVPIYNGDSLKALPCAGGGCSFDEDKNAATTGCAVKTTNGEINLAETVRNGLFGKTPKNNDRFEVEFKYRLNDGSKKALNRIRVKLYYYETAADVSDDLKQTLQEHEGTIIGANSAGTPQVATTAKARPRPPCIIVIAR